MRKAMMDQQVAVRVGIEVGVLETSTTGRGDGVPTNVERWVLEHAGPPARLLEVGCGDGDLARSLVRRGFDVIAIDPDAPEGRAFQTTSLEDFDSPEPFDVV